LLSCLRQTLHRNRCIRQPAGIRPLLKKYGLMIVSTNVSNRAGHTLEFNVGGGLQTGSNTFWYHSVPMLEYLIRYFKMVPIDCLYCPHSDANPANFAPGVNSGYLSVMGRAIDDGDIKDNDSWAGEFARGLVGIPVAVQWQDAEQPASLDDLVPRCLG
jgi:hypothetical protein